MPVSEARHLLRDLVEAGAQFLHLLVEAGRRGSVLKLRFQVANPSASVHPSQSKGARGCHSRYRQKGIEPYHTLDIHSASLAVVKVPSPALSVFGLARSKKSSSRDWASRGLLSFRKR